MSQRLARVCALVAGAVLVGVLCPATGRAAFSGTLSLDAETCNTSQFSASEIERGSASTSPTITVTNKRTDPAHVIQGQCSFRYYMPANGKRAENRLGGTAGSIYNLPSGTSVWVARWQYLAPNNWAEQGFNVGHHETMQLKTIDRSIGGPFAMSDGGAGGPCGTSPCWQMQPFEGGTSQLIAQPVVKGQWQGWLYHFVLSQDPAVGLIEIWQNGALQFSQHHQTIDSHGNPDYYKQGIYQNRAISAPSIVWIDGTTISTSEAAAERGAWGTATKGPGTPPASGAAVTAVASATPDHAIARRTKVQFDGSRSTGAVSYRWSLDGYTYLSGAKPTFVFQHPGTKHVTLTVTGAKGRTDSASLEVVVR